MRPPDRQALCLGRACTLAPRTDDDVAAVCDHVLDDDAVLPVVPEVVVIEDLAADLSDSTEWCRPLVHKELRFFIVATAEANVAGVEVVKVAIFSTEWLRRPKPRARGRSSKRGRQN